MIRSMTSYAQHEIKKNWGNAIWEIRSVNQRYLEINFYLPEEFRRIEPIARKQIRCFLARGKIDCSLYFKPNINQKNKLILNKTLAKELIENANWIKLKSDEGSIDPIDILRWPGVISIQEENLNDIRTDLLKGLNLTLDNLINAREAEGAKLKILIEERLEKISHEINYIRSNMPKILTWQHERLLKRIQETKINFENNRLEQELLIMLQRIDVSEELDRLNAHTQEIYKTLKKDEAIGRRLDFIMQECNRESNTLASKSINIDITTSAIELKVLIEQIREQIQNIE